MYSPALARVILDRREIDVFVQSCNKASIMSEKQRRFVVSYKLPMPAPMSAISAAKPMQIELAECGSVAVVLGGAGDAKAGD